MGSPVSSLVGCQSMGCMRSSNEFDFPSFHFRMIVQIIATPPTTDAITIMTVVVVFCIAAFFTETLLGTAEAAASTELVTRTTLGVGAVVGDTLAIDVVGKTAEMDDKAEVMERDDEEMETTLLDDDGMLAVVMLSVMPAEETCAGSCERYSYLRVTVINKPCLRMLECQVCWVASRRLGQAREGWGT
jgi:hypothetical protein